MIEINLLPQEYRVQGVYAPGLILTIVLGMLTVGAIGIYGIDLKNQLSAETAKNVSLTNDRDKFKTEAEKIDKLKKDIATAQKRQDAIINISQSKIVWSQKMIQFGRILANYPDFWIDRLALAKSSAKGGGTITLGFYAVGNDLRNIAQFRERMTSDTNFWYHFDTLQAPRTQVQENGGPLATYGYKGNVIFFACTMPLK